LYFGFAGNEQVPKTAPLKRLFYHLLRLAGAIKYSHQTIRNLYPRKVSEHIYTAGYHDCTHAYGLTLSGAQKLAQLQQPITFVADNLLAHAVTNGLVKGYIVHPKIINQQYQVSDKSTYSYLNQ
jgi:glycosyl transferase family 25